MSSWYEWRDAPEAEFAVIGDPIAHSMSPVMFAAAGIPERYIRCRVPMDEFELAIESLRRRGFWGLNVTLPLKERAFEYLRPTDSLAQKARAVNTLDFRKGVSFNTDLDGITESLKLLGGSFERALVIGAGGTARSVCLMLAAAGTQIRCFNRTQARIQVMAEVLGIPIEATDQLDCDGCDLVVQTTSAHLSDQPMQWDLLSLANHAVGFDVGYRAEPTEFCRTFLERGQHALDGKWMLVSQGASSYLHWTGRSVDRQVMLAALEAR